MQVTTIGLDLAKNVFQVHGVTVERPDQFDPWFADILERKPAKLAAVAMANKTARIIWAVLTRGHDYRIRTA